MRAVCFTMVCVALSCVALCGSASAQAGDSHQVKSAASQTLFEEGRALMQAGRLGEACSKFAESQRLEAALGTLLNLALCHEQQGKTATAWLEYSDALSQAARENDAERKAIAQARIDELKPSLARLTLVLPALLPAGLWFELDGVRLPPVAWDRGIPVDPGIHALRFGADHKREIELGVSVLSAATELKVGLPDLPDADVPAKEKPCPVVARSAPEKPAVQPVRWLLSGSAFGIAAAGLAFGSYFGLHAGAEWRERDRNCSPGCNDLAVAAGSRAHTAATLATISFATALIAAGAGTLLALSASRAQAREALRVNALIAPGFAALGATGHF